ncbi:uv-b-insensitive 4 [Trifolium repens]|nr:uv-b-insensitive 4 [Trifolium repens]
MLLRFFWFFCCSVSCCCFESSRSVVKFESVAGCCGGFSAALFLQLCFWFFCCALLGLFVSESLLFPFSLAAIERRRSRLGEEEIQQTGTQISGNQLTVFSDPASFSASGCYSVMVFCFVSLL